MPDNIIPEIGNQAAKLHDVMALWRESALVIAGGGTYTFPVIDTEFGRTIPDALSPPNSAAAVSILTFNSKKLSLKVWTTTFADFCLRVDLYEDSAVAGGTRILAARHYCYHADDIRIDHEAKDRFVFIELVNEPATGITDGEIAIFSRL